MVGHISIQRVVFYKNFNETNPIEPEEKKINEPRREEDWKGIVREVEGNQGHHVSEKSRQMKELKGMGDQQCQCSSEFKKDNHLLRTMVFSIREVIDSSHKLSYNGMMRRKARLLLVEE